MGPQQELQLEAAPPAKILAVAGPSAIGKSHLLSLLLQDFPESLQRVERLTTAPPARHAGAAADYAFVAPDRLDALLAKVRVVLLSLQLTITYGATQSAERRSLCPRASAH